LGKDPIPKTFIRAKIISNNGTVAVKSGKNQPAFQYIADRFIGAKSFFLSARKTKTILIYHSTFPAGTAA